MTSLNEDEFVNIPKPNSIEKISKGGSIKIYEIMNFAKQGIM
jgi:hypothetical protein